MSQGFRLKFDDMQENKSSAQASEHLQGNGSTHSEYDETGYIRNICFVWEDGKRIFLNYSYLIAGEFLQEESEILLEFTSHAVLLKGVELEKLYYQIMQQLIKEVICLNVRYNSIHETGSSIVNEMKVTKKE